MRKFVNQGLLALALAAFLVPQGWAWKNDHFGIGMNWSCQSGGNNLLYGLFINGQPPGVDAPVAPVPPGFPAFGAAYGVQGMPAYGAAPRQGVNSTTSQTYYTNPYRFANYYYNYNYNYGR